MRITFVNSQIDIPNTSINSPGNYFDGPGLLQIAESNIVKAEEYFSDLSAKENKLTYRHEEENNNLLETLTRSISDTDILKLSESYGFSLGKKTNLILYNEDLKAYKWEKISVVGIKYTSKVNVEKEYMTLANATGDILHTFEKECTHSVVRLSLKPGFYSKILSYNFNRDKIIDVSVRTNEEDWIDIDLDTLMDLDRDISINLAGSIYNNYLSFEKLELGNNGWNGGFSEIRLVLKNEKIGNTYFLNTRMIALEDKASYNSKPIRATLPINVSNVFFQNLNNKQKSLFMGKILTSGKEYNIQLPGFCSTDLSRFSELDLISSTANHSIYRCPYPVSISEVDGAYIKIYDNLSLKNPMYFLWSLDLQTWNTGFTEYSASLYGSRYSLKPRYFYVKIPKAKGSMFISYRLKNDINCYWPLSLDGNIMFDGNGLKFRTPQKDITIIGNAVGAIETVAVKDSYHVPYGILGVD
jgi:hypothetical protein